MRISDWSSDVCSSDLDRRARLRLAREDATRLSLADGSVDRLLACHVLEPLQHPHDVLREWYRVLRKGGALSIRLPCDPGVPSRVGRMVGPRAHAERARTEFGCWVASRRQKPNS